jgi:hypothetical protein
MVLFFFPIVSCILLFVPCTSFFSQIMFLGVHPMKLDSSIRFLFFCVSFMIIHHVREVVLMGFGLGHSIPSNMFAKKTATWVQ